MPKYIIKEGILDNFINSIFNAILQGRVERFKQKVDEIDPELASKIDNIRKETDELVDYMNGKMSKEKRKEIEKKYNF